VFITHQALITVRKDDRFDITPVLARRSALVLGDTASGCQGLGRRVRYARPVKVADEPIRNSLIVRPVRAAARRRALAFWGNECCTVVSTLPV
jgi:hypothetical protein